MLLYRKRCLHNSQDRKSSRSLMFFKTGPEAPMVGRVTGGHGPHLHSKKKKENKEKKKGFQSRNY